jgi:solute carrier family 25 (mitochondrial iron transporter), member 28/37
LLIPFFEQAVAGASATTAADALMNPFDGTQHAFMYSNLGQRLISTTYTVIKQRMQVHKSEFKSIFTCARTVYRNEGLAAFYVSYPTTLAISIPFNAIQYTIYEHLKRAMNPRHEYSPSTHIIAGAGAGAVAAAITTPLDVAKTMLQTRGTSHDPEIRNVRGMMDALKVIWAKDGVKGFGRGLTPRVMTTMPSSALCWLSYEFFSK